MSDHIAIYDRDATGQSAAVLHSEDAAPRILLKGPSITQVRKGLGHVKRAHNLLMTPVIQKIGIPYMPNNGTPVPTPSATGEFQKPHFSPAKRAAMAARVVRAIIAGNTSVHAAVLAGRGGTGKSYVVKDELTKSNLTQISIDAETEVGEGEFDASANYYYISGAISATALYKLLYAAREGALIVFDDADAAFDDEIRTNLLKAVLDTTANRVVTWMSPYITNMGLPSSFEFSGRAIFISNRKVDKIPQALLSRALILNLDMNNMELVDYVEQIAPGLLPELSAAQASALCHFARQHMHNFRDMSLRTFQKAESLVTSFPDDFEDMLLFAL